jgi:mannosidase alpha-like ER degradation enhancer 2
LAEDVARRLIAAFDTATGMPYGTVNLRYGVPVGETSITCTAGVGTFILEFGTLSRLTGDPLFEEVRGSGNMVRWSVWLVIAED